ncbi:MAG TPA: hypothetical protein VMM92_01465, partial [Thermoanaerobaculia bacterium]|nr:hypothetical protein [Thermoanaerobaculia bacterium]
INLLDNSSAADPAHLGTAGRIVVLNTEDILLKSKMGKEGLEKLMAQKKELERQLSHPAQP